MRHDQNHFGRQRSIGFIRDRFYWKGFSDDIDVVVKSCEACQRRKKVKMTAGKLHMIEVKRKFERVQMDLYSGVPSSDGYKAILVVTDYLTKWVVLIPIPNKTASTVIKAFWEHFVKPHGIPEIIQTDRGVEFVSNLSKEFWSLMADKMQSTPFHPRSQGVVERFNRTMSDMLAKIVGEQQTKWSQYLPRVQLEYNATVHSVTGFSPYYLVYGQPLRTSLDIVLSKGGRKEDLEEE